VFVQYLTRVQNNSYRVCDTNHKTPPARKKHSGDLGGPRADMSAEPLEPLEPLISAVIAIRLEEPNATAKSLHARIISKDEWKEVSFSDVKKAASKATKREAQTPTLPQHRATPTDLTLGQNVRIRALAEQPAMAGVHGKVNTFLANGNVQICTIGRGDDLTVPRDCIEPANATDSKNSISYSTKDVAVVRWPCRGYGLRAQRAFAKGELIYREKPIAKSWDLQACMEVGAGARDPTMLGLMHELQPFLDAEAAVPPTLMDRILERVAQLDFDSLPDEKQRSWMALCDSFSDPPTKTPNNIWRSNAYSQGGDGEQGGHLYDVCCRANHSCSPNMSHAFEGDTMVLVAKKAVAKGDELLTCYLAECLEPGRPTGSRQLRLKERYNFLCMCERCGHI
jgi:hypothetical protein